MIYEQIDKLFADLGTHWDGLDILVHSIGFAPGDALSGEFLDGLTRENFRIAHDISAYSFPALAKAARPLMKGRGGAVLTLTYLGAEKVIPGIVDPGGVLRKFDPAKHYLFPFPQSEIDINKNLTQNPGY